MKRFSVYDTKAQQVRWLSVVFLFNSVLGLYGDAPSKPSLNNYAASVKEHLHEDQAIEKYHLYLKATYQHARGNLQDSLHSFEQLIKSEMPVEVYDGFIRFLFDADQYEAIAQIPDKIWLAFNDSLDLQIIRVKALLQTQRIQEASKYLTFLQVKYPDDEQVLYYSTAFCLQKGDFKKALLIVDKALSNKALAQKAFLFYHLKSKILLSQGRKQEAMTFAEKSVELFPRFSKGWLFKALLLEQLGHINAAISGYERFLELVGSNEMVEKQLINLMFAHGRVAQAEEQMKKIAQFKPEYYFELARMKWKQGKDQEALDYLNQATTKKTNFTRVQLLKVEILLAQKDYSKVLSCMREWLSAFPYDKTALQTMFLLRKAGVPAHSLIQTFNEVMNAGKTHSRILLALADMHLENKEYRKALPLYEKLLPRAKGNLMRSKILFQQAYVYYVSGDYLRMIPLLEKAIHIQPAYPSAYNLLAYYYVDTNQQEKFKEAFDLSERALESNPKSSCFLDTHGYVLFKMGQRTMAKKFFQKALECGGNKDPLILQHLSLVAKD